ncbi:2524_t:CDS:2 [Ambispora leptoticha]|uniref:2524_t:CDS:1 n=1 Tax=Ambispora leptoticha TaxID=144679 RepID=A0A9N9N3G0_9GLOM|nr:2524_t:CDS:2 [Ambispora leptoticha]
MSCEHPRDAREEDDAGRNCCTKCGLVFSEIVVTEPYDQIGMQNKAREARNFINEGFVLGNDTIMNGKKMSHVFSGARLNKPSLPRTHFLKMTCGALGIMSLQEHVWSLVLQYDSKNHLKLGRELDYAIAAAAYITIRERKLAVTLYDIGKTTKISPGDINSLARHMIKVLGMKLESPNVSMESLLAGSIEAMFHEDVIHHLPLYTKDLMHLYREVNTFPQAIYLRHSENCANITAGNCILVNNLPEIMELYRKVLIGTAYYLLEYASNAGFITGRNPIPMTAAILLYAIEATEKPSVTERVTNHKMVEEFVACAFDIRPDRIMLSRYKEIRYHMNQQVQKIHFAYLAKDDPFRSYLYINDLIKFFPPELPNIARSWDQVEVPSIVRSRQQKTLRLEKIQRARKLVGLEPSTLSIGQQVSKDQLQQQQQIVVIDDDDVRIDFQDQQQQIIVVDDIEKEQDQHQQIILVDDIGKERDHQQEVVVTLDERVDDGVTDDPYDEELQFLKELLLSEKYPDEQLLDASSGVLQAWVYQNRRGTINNNHLNDRELCEKDCPDDELCEYIEMSVNTAAPSIISSSSTNIFEMSCAQVRAKKGRPKKEQSSKGDVLDKDTQKSNDDNIPKDEKGTSYTAETNNNQIILDPREEEDIINDNLRIFLNNQLNSTKNHNNLRSHTIKRKRIKRLIRDPPRKKYKSKDSGTNNVSVNEGANDNNNDNINSSSIASVPERDESASNNKSRSKRIRIRAEDIDYDMFT